MNNEVIQFMERSENSWRSQFMTIVNSAVATAAARSVLACKLVVQVLSTM